jgi:hypothetical protein
MLQLYRPRVAAVQRNDKRCSGVLPCVPRGADSARVRGCAPGVRCAAARPPSTRSGTRRETSPSVVTMVREEALFGGSSKGELPDVVDDVASSASAIPSRYQLLLATCLSFVICNMVSGGATIPLGSRSGPPCGAHAQASNAEQTHCESLRTATLVQGLKLMCTIATHPFSRRSPPQHSR